MKQVICRRNGATTGNTFTDGKVYKVKNRAGYEDFPLKVYEIIDDNGWLRIISIGEPSAHLLKPDTQRGMIAVGVFEEIAQ